MNHNQLNFELHNLPEPVATEIEHMVYDGSDVECRIGNVKFIARMKFGGTIKKFEPKERIGYQFTMVAGEFKVDKSSLIEVIEVLAETKGWIVQSWCVEFKDLEVTLQAVKGHSNGSDLIVALDAKLLPYKHRVVDARGMFKIEYAGARVHETLKLTFGKQAESRYSSVKEPNDDLLS